MEQEKKINVSGIFNPIVSLLEKKEYKASVRMVLVELANKINGVNEEGYETCTISLQALANILGFGKRTVQYAIETLIKEKIIYVENMPSYEDRKHKQCYSYGFFNHEIFTNHNNYNNIYIPDGYSLQHTKTKNKSSLRVVPFTNTKQTKTDPDFRGANFATDPDFRGANFATSRSNINIENNKLEILNNSFLKKTRGRENFVFPFRQLSENNFEINDSNFLSQQEPASAAKDTFTGTDQVLETKPLTETGDVTMDSNFLIQQKQDSLTKQSGSDQLFDRPKSPANQPTGWERPFNRKECRKGCKELADAESEKESEIKIPKKVQEIISHWELQEIDSKKLYVPKKQFWKTTKKFVKDLNELLKNQDIEDVKVAIERFAIAALDENFAPRNKEKYSKYSIKDFFFGKYRNNGELTNLDLLNKYLSAPPKPIETTPENKYPSIVKTLKKRYDIEIMKNIRALIPCDGTEEMKMYIECSHNLIAFFERIENRTGYLGTYEMADLLFDAVLYSIGTNDPMIFTVKTLCLGRSKEIWEERLLKYLTHLRYIDNNESNNTFSIYGDKYKDIEILNKAVKQEAEKRLEQLESEGREPVYDDEDEDSFEEDQAKNPWKEDIPLEEQYDQEDLNKLAILYDDMSLYRDISFPKIVKQTEPEPVERQPIIPKWRLEQQKIDGWVALYEKKEAEKLEQRNSMNES